ncbi:DMT family transporter [Aliivibrio finisterrensis]|uniref:DMT family transporter n=1 Tax=Aliivibrio finisterrensis TaxID=511998 RepID=A0A4Q5KJ04_9GAMM|nr:MULTISPECIES: DMT family transporter [Aliivibrio]MDD9174433.1 DMT family transporter [Aliivibrio sp. S3TY1]MDD9191511.1 DMT family transporter [Aliivibrio sp. S2TY2]RYU45454.1 DMT family transporter [Aliivibrio finisterrensis]
MRGVLYLVIATILAAIGWGASKMVVMTIPGDIFIGTRFLLASLVLLPFCYKQLRNLTIKQGVALTGVGLVLSLALQVWVYAVAITSSLAEGAFIMSLAMLIAPLIAWILFRQKPNKAFWLALPISIFGMMLLTLGNGWKMEPSQLGFMLSSLLLSLHFVLNKRVIGSITPLLSICVQMFVVGISGCLYASFNSHAPFELTEHAIFWFLISTIVATAIRYLAQTLGQFSVEIETASLIMILEPIWTLLISVTLLNEMLETQKMFGGGAIILSLLLYIKLSRRLR